MSGALEAAVRVVLEEIERSRAAEVEAAVRKAVRQYRSSVLLDKEVGLEIVDLVYRFKHFNPGQKLNLNFDVDPPPLPEGVIEEMIEDY